MNVHAAPAAPRSGLGAVLVAEVEGRAGLATARGLSRAGYAVTGAASTRTAPGHWSRSCARRVLLPDPYAHPRPFVDALVGELHRGGFTALLPTTDLVLQLVSQFREQLPTGVATGLPAHRTVELALEKRTLDDAAAAYGIPSPPFVSCRTEAELLDAARSLGFPAMLKPARSVVSSGSSHVRRGATLVEDESTALAAAAKLGEDVIVQRFEPGARILAIGGVATPGGVLGWVGARWKRRWPPRDGAASFCETVPVSPATRESIEGVVRTMGLRGIFELELLQRQDGTVAALDLNPRPFGWMTLAIRAGANLPAIWCDWILGREPRPGAARAGVRYRWEDGDLKHLLWHLRRRRLRAATAVLRPHSRVVHAYFELTDPGPLPAAFLYLLRRRGRR